MTSSNTRKAPAASRRRFWPARSHRRHPTRPLHLDERLQEQQKIFEEDDEEDDETDVSLVIDRERQRLLRWYRDPLRRGALEHERLYLQEYITTLSQISVDSKFEAFQDLLRR